MNIIAIGTKVLAFLTKWIGGNWVGRKLRKLLSWAMSKIIVRAAAAGSAGFFGWLGDTLYEVCSDLSKAGTKYGGKIGQPNLWNDSMEPQLIAAIRRGPEGLKSN